MCVISERDNVVCGHRDTFKELCKKAIGGDSIFGHFRRCKIVINLHYYYEICHNCRRFWQNRRVSHYEAIEATHKYRLDTDTHAPIPPAVVLAHQEETAANLDRGNRNRKEIKRDMHPLTNLVGNESNCTLWPQLIEEEQPEPSYPLSPPEPIPQAHLRPQSSTSSMTDYGTITVAYDSSAKIPDPNNFDLERGDRQLQTLKSADINKPVPKAPRQGLPMPGRPFDPQSPDRDLPSNKSYPRGERPRPTSRRSTDRVPGSSKPGVLPPCPVNGRQPPNAAPGCRGPIKNLARTGSSQNQRRKPLNKNATLKWI